MKIGVTAATGQLGSQILENLAATIGTDNVVGIARAPDKVTVPEIETRAADYADAAAWPEALDGLDTVVLVSSPMGPYDRVQMHWNVIEGGALAGVRKMLYTSVIGNGKEAATLYAPVAAVNRQAEEHLKASGMDWVVPRNGLYLDIDVGHILSADQNGGVFRNNAGDGRCGYINRSELAFATAKLALNESANGKIFNLVGECYTQQELVDTVNAVCGSRVRYEAISDDENFAKLEPARGELVARMLTGCYQSIRVGAYDVPSDFAAAAGRPATSIAEQIKAIRSIS